MSEILKSRELSIIVMFLSFLAVFVPYFIDAPALETFSTKLITITAITTAFTLLLAIHSQFKRGFEYVRRKPRGWIFKVYMMITIILMLLFALGGLETGPYHWVMYAIITPLSSVNYGILTFYLSSTCARAFRARNTRSLLLILTGFVMLLYQAPFTGAYVDLGYVFPNEAAVASAAQDWQGVIHKDFYGQSTDGTFLDEIHDWSDWTLISDYTTGIQSGSLINHFGLRGTPMIVNCIGVMISTQMPYLSTGVYKALLQSMRGGAELEYLTRHPGPGMTAMDAFTLGHYMLVVLIIIGNIGYFGTRENSRRNVK